MAEITDEYILELIGKKMSRERGLTLLIDKYKERIYWHIRRLVVSHEDSEDVMQETFINVIRFIDTFEGNSKLYTWLYRVATNECIKLFRKKKDIFMPLDGSTLAATEYLRTNSTPDSEEIERRLQEAILKLPEKQRIVFNLRYYDELPYEEISKILNINTGSLKTSYHYAYERVKQEMLNNEIL